MLNLAVFIQVLITSIISVYIFPMAEYLNKTYKIPENPARFILFLVAVLVLYVIQIYLNDKAEFGRYSKFVEDTNKNYEKFEGVHNKIDTYIDKHMSGIQKIEKLIRLNQKKTLNSISRHIEEMEDQLGDRIKRIDEGYTDKIYESKKLGFRKELNELMKYSSLKLHILTSEIDDSFNELDDKEEVN